MENTQTHKPHISVIIPVFNGGRTLEACLKALFCSACTAFEVILVNDASKDNSLEIAKNFPVRIISNEINKGRGISKNIGTKEARGEILLFIDSDVIVEKNTLSVIAEAFHNNPYIAAVTGVPKPENPCKNFASQFKSVYMNYVFSILPKNVDFAYGSVQAFRKDPVFNREKLHFNKDLYCDDIDFGLRVKGKGMKILLIPDVKIIHIKHHSMLSLIKNDFRVPAEFARIMLKRKVAVQSIKKKRFAHTSLQQVLAVIVAPFAVIMMFISILSGSLILYNMALGLLLVYVCLNFSFYKFIYRAKGPAFLIQSILFNLLDQIVMAAGILTGALRGLGT